jgi:hypothetical protein
MTVIAYVFLNIAGSRLGEAVQQVNAIHDAAR